MPVAMDTGLLILALPQERPRSALEFAERIRSRDLPVSVWLPESETVPWSQELEQFRRLCPVLVGTASAPEHPVEFLVDTSLQPSSERRALLQQLQQRFPQALWLRSGLTESATAFAHTLGSSNVVAFDALPGLLRTLQRIEIAAALNAPADALSKAQELFSALGYAVEVVEDRVGLVIPRILAMLINEGAFAVMERAATPQDIDTAMRLGTGYPKGVLEWGDEIGLEVVLAILDALYAEYRQERYRACVLLRQYARAQRLGRHTHQGFYRYD